MDKVDKEDLVMRTSRIVGEGHTQMAIGADLIRDVLQSVGRECDFCVIGRPVTWKSRVQASIVQLSNRQWDVGDIHGLGHKS